MSGTVSPSAGLLDPALLDRYLRTLDQGLPDVRPDTTPSGSGLFTRIISKLGEAAGSPGPETLKALSPRDREDAGLQALSRFGTGLLRASGSGQWIGSNLGSAFEAAERGYDQTGRQAVGMLAARQGYAVQQQQDQLARIKEALPFLTLAQQQHLAATVPFTVGGRGGGQPGGQPGGLLDALASIESGDQNIVSRTDSDSRGRTLAQGGDASEISQGHFQIQTATWRDFADKAGVDISQYPTPMSAPREVQARVASVIPLSRFGPRTQDLLRSRFGALDTNQTLGTLAGTPPLAFTPGTAGPRAATPPPTAAAPPPVGTQPPGAPVQIPPPAQVAGPGAPTEAAPAPATPGPPTFAYRPSQIPPGLIPPGTFTPEQQAAVRTIEDAYTHERQAALTPADIQKAESNFGTNMTKVLGSQTDAAKVATDALLKFHEADFKQQQDTHGKMLDDYLKQQQAEQAQKFKLAEIAATGEQTQKNTAAGAVVARNTKALEALDTDSKAAADTIPQLEALRALSDNIDENQPWAKANIKLATIPFAGTTLLNRLTQLRLVDPATAGPVQQLQGGISGVVAQLRQGMSMGALSDRDLSFIESLGPSLYEDKATRSAVISYLQQSQRAKLRFNIEVNKEMTRPNANVAEAVDNAQRTIETRHPIVPQMPADIYAARGSPDPATQARVMKWASDNNVKRNTLIRKPDGYLELVR